MPLACVAQPADNDAGVRAAVARSLPWIEKEGVAWMNDRGCVTCHHGNFLIWSHREAARRGIPIDAQKAEEWTTWSLLKILSGMDGSTPQGSETLAQAVLARDERSLLTAKPRLWTRTIDPYENVLKYLLKEQTADGKWGPGGQAEYPPDVSTGWALFALAVRERLMKSEDAKINPAHSANGGLEALVKSNNAAIPKSQERALAWLKTVKEDKARDLNEQLVTRLLIETCHGDDASRSRRREDLLARQSADGGWSANPIVGPRGSDAFATGQSLYALALAGIGADHAAIIRARAFLIGSQEADGSWKVPTSAIHKPSGNAERDARIDEVYHFWGTTWAVLGLLHTLPMSAAAAAGE